MELSDIACVSASLYRACMGALILFKNLEWHIANQPRQGEIIVYENLIVDRRDGCTEIRLHRPDKLNAIRSV